MRANVILPKYRAVFKSRMSSEDSRLVKIVKVFEKRIQDTLHICIDSSEQTTTEEKKDKRPNPLPGLCIIHENRPSLVAKIADWDPLRESVCIIPGDALSLDDTPQTLFNDNIRFFTQLIGEAKFFTWSHTNAENQVVLEFEEDDVHAFLHLFAILCLRLAAYALCDRPEIDGLLVMKALEQFCDAAADEQLFDNLGHLESLTRGLSRSGVNHFVTRLLSSEADSYHTLLTCMRADITIRQILAAPRTVFKEDLNVFKQCRQQIQGHLLAYLRHLNGDPLTFGDVSSAYVSERLHAAECQFAEVDPKNVIRNNIADESLAYTRHITDNTFPHSTSLPLQSAANVIEEAALRTLIPQRITHPAMRTKVRALYAVLSRLEHVIGSVRLIKPSMECFCWLLILAGYLAMTEYRAEIDAIWDVLRSLFQYQKDDVLLCIEELRQVLSSQDLRKCIASPTTSPEHALNKYEVLSDPRVHHLVKQYVAGHLHLFLQHQAEGRGFPLLNARGKEVLLDLISHPTTLLPAPAYIRQPQTQLSILSSLSTAKQTESESAILTDGVTHLMHGLIPSLFTATTERASSTQAHQDVPVATERSPELAADIVHSFHLALRCLRKSDYLDLFLPLICYQTEIDWNHPRSILQEQWKQELFDYGATQLHRATLLTFLQTYVLPADLTTFPEVQHFMQDCFDHIHHRNTWVDSEKDLHTFCELLINIWNTEKEKALETFSTSLKTLRVLFDAETTLAEYSRFLQHDWTRWLKHYRSILRGQTSWAGCIHLLVQHGAAIFVLPSQKPPLAPTLFMLSEEGLRDALKNHKLGHTLPVTELAKRQDLEGNTLLHIAMALYPELSEAAQQQVLVLCLLSQPDVKNHANQTPLDCLQMALSQEIISEDEKQQLEEEFIFYLSETRQQAIQAVEEERTKNLVTVLTDRLAQAEQKNADLETKNTTLETEKTDLQTKNSDLAREKAELEDELRRYKEQAKSTPGSGSQGLFGSLFTTTTTSSTDPVYTK